MRRILATFLVVVLPLTATATGRADLGEGLNWLYGYWELSTDEDGGVRGMDVDEFRPDGTYSILGPGCKPQLGRYHVFDSDIYVTYDVQGKGPVAMIFRPNATKTILTYTSPRTRNNSTYEKLQRSPCDHG